MPDLHLLFSQSVNTTGDGSGFWCIDEWGNTQNGGSVIMIGSDTIRVSFMSSIAAAPAQVGIVAGFSGIVEYADLLSPGTWRV